MGLGFLDDIYYGNSVKQYIVAGGIAVAVVLLARVVRSLILHRFTALAEQTTTNLDDIGVEVARSTRLWTLILLSLYLGSFYLELDEQIAETAQVIAVTTLLLQIGIWCTAGLKAAVQEIHEEKMVAGDTAGLGAVQMMSLIGRIAAWSIVALLILANLGVNISALIAGLGIGGIAVALALQNVLGDLFASVSIVLDKPFEVGDFLVIDDCMGNVESVGLKTTRVRSLSGEQLIFANGDLLGSRIRNYKRMQERRALFCFGVTYQTSAEKLARIPELVRGIVETTEKTRFDRAHFKSFGASSLDFEAVYFVLEPDYTSFMDAQEHINLKLYEELEKEGIEFAYPTQTLYVNKAA